MNTAPIGKTNASDWLGGSAAKVHPWLFALLFAELSFESVRGGLSLAEPAPAFPAWARVWCAAALSLGAGLARRLPLQNVAAVAALAGGGGACLEALNLASGLPFGPRRLGPGLADDPAGAALAAGALWFSLVVLCRGVARLVLRGARGFEYYGLWVLAAAATLGTALLGLTDPVGQAAGDWRWEALTRWLWMGTPLAATLGWWVTLLVLTAFSVPWLLSKRPVIQPTDWHPLVVWVGLSAWVGLSLGATGAVAGGATALGLGAAVGAAGCVGGRRREG